MTRALQQQRSGEARQWVERLRVAAPQAGDLFIDSRAIRAGDVFVAVPGIAQDGRRYVSDALAAGAVAVLKEGAAESGETVDARVIHIEDLSALQGLIAATYYDWPARRLKVFGVTGTNGKTTVTWWLQQLLDALATPCALLGTLGAGFRGRLDAAVNTTPDAVSVQRSLHTFAQAGAQAAAMEVSSHALELNRTAGLSFEAVVLTNLTQDHLDFHGSMEAYAAAKSQLFEAYDAQHRIINADDELGRKLLAMGLPNTVSYGVQAGDVRADVKAMSTQGTHLMLRTPWGTADVHVPTVGVFNVYNLLAVTAVLLASGHDFQRVVAVLSTIEAAPGRLQQVRGSVEQPAVYVDYAHTPDALAQVLKTLRAVAERRLLVVFGCGGDRDRSKRPIMGRVAAEWADHVVLTNDNPRTESPEQIVADIRTGISGELDAAGRVQVCLDRRQAITETIQGAAAGDVVLLAGKGHETYQEINKVRYPLSDVAIAQAALQRETVEVGHVVQ